MFQRMARRKERFGSTGFEKWGGYMNAKKQKLDHQFKEQKPFEFCFEKGSEIFKNVAIYVDGYTKPTSDELKRLMMINGGQFHHYYSQKTTTHIIATNLPFSKIQQLKNKKVIRPEWITDSIKAGKLLPESGYYLYNLSRNQQTLNFANNCERINSDHTVINDSQSVVKNSAKAEHLFNIEESNSDLFKCKDSNNLEELNIENNENKILQLFCDTKRPSEQCKSSRRAGEPNFLSEFYNNSRLHHISTAKSDFQAYVTQLRNMSDGNFPGRVRLRNEFQNEQENCEMTNKIFMHVDMDCFFVSVSLLNYPHLKGKPVAVTHSKSYFRQPPPGSNRQYEYNYYRKKYEENHIDSDNHDFTDTVDEFGSASEIASCNYEARKYGIKNGFFLGEAKKMCPELQTVPYNFEGYKKVSKLLYDIVASYSLDIEAVSCDELFIDCSSVLEEIRVSPLEFASCLRKEIKEKTGCTASTGIGSNLLLARLATKAAKPNGQYMVDHDKIDQFIEKQLVKDLPGVGYVLQKNLESKNFKTCKDLQKVPFGKLQEIFGRKTGQMLYEYCRGIDSREIKTEIERKSVSAEINYGMRFKATHEATNFLKELAEEVQKRLLKNNVRGKSVTLKLKIRKSDAPKETSKFMGHGVCNNITKTLQLSSATNNSVTISRVCSILLQNLKINPEDIRGMGIQIGRLEKLSKNPRGGNHSLLNFINQSPHKSTSVSKPSNLSEEDLSEVDPNIFALLPEDLQREISEYFKSKGKNINFKVNNSAAVEKRNSHSSLSDHNSDNYKKLQNSDFPNFSQIDPTVFNALPDDVKQEIMDAYNRESHPLNVVSMQKSPKKSPAKNKTKVKKHKKLNANIKHSTCQPNRSELQTVTKRECIQVPTLCGVSSLEGIKKLLSEWVASSIIPQDDDTIVFTQYAIDVVKERNLEKLDRIVKHLHRLVKNTANEDWQIAYKNIISTIQSTVLEIYGSTLKVDVEF